MSEAGPFECRLEVRGSDLDANRHLRNTVFSEYATHTRFSLLASHGFSQTRFEALRFGPVMFREEIRYRREVLFGDAVAVNVLFGGLAVDGSQWKVVQEVHRSDGRQATVLTVLGGNTRSTSRFGSVRRKPVAPRRWLGVLVRRDRHIRVRRVRRQRCRSQASAPALGTLCFSLNSDCFPARPAASRPRLSDETIRCGSGNATTRKRSNGSTNPPRAWTRFASSR